MKDSKIPLELGKMAEYRRVVFGEIADVLMGSDVKSSVTDLGLALEFEYLGTDFKIESSLTRGYKEISLFLVENVQQSQSDTNKVWQKVSISARVNDQNSSINDIDCERDVFVQSLVDKIHHHALKKGIGNAKFIK